MDFWASLEHQLKYKKDVENEEEIVKQLKVCADTIHSTDEKMLAVRKMIEKDGNAADDGDFFDKLRKIDISVE